MRRIPGPIGARCSDCVFGPDKGEGTILWFCRKEIVIVSAGERCCSEYTPRNGRVTTPYLPHKEAQHEG